jgi:hypothetical protein
MTTPQPTRTTRRRGCISTLPAVVLVVVGLAVSITRRAEEEPAEVDPAVTAAVLDDSVFADPRVISDVSSYDAETYAIVRTYLRANLTVDMIRNGGNIPREYVDGYFTGDALTDVQADIDALEAAGQARLIDEDHSYAGFVRVTGLTSTNATVEECVVRDRPLIDLASGDVLDDTVTTQHLRAFLEFDPASGWLISEVEVLQEWDGEDGCAEE